MGKFKRTTCIIYGSNEQSIWWWLQKIELRITQKSLLWENCCSGKCYRDLLQGLIDKKYHIVNQGGITILEGKP